MRITNASFSITYRKKMYHILMSVQHVYQNGTSATIHVMQIDIDAGTKRSLLSVSAFGRQLLNPESARKYLRIALVADGVIKPKEEPENEEK